MNNPEFMYYITIIFGPVALLLFGYFVLRTFGFTLKDVGRFFCSFENYLFFILPGILPFLAIANAPERFFGTPSQTGLPWEWEGKQLGIALSFLTYYLGLWMHWFGWKCYEEYRAIRDTETSTIQSANDGLVEIQGTAQPLQENQLISAPLSQNSCLYYQIDGLIKAKEDQTSHHSPYDTLFQEEQIRPFLIEDESGAILVDPNAFQLGGMTVEEAKQGAGTIHEASYETLSAFKTDIDLDVKTRMKTSGYDREWMEALDPQEFYCCERTLLPGSTMYALGSKKPLETIENHLPDDVQIPEQITHCLTEDPERNLFILSERKEKQVAERNKKSALFFILTGSLLSLTVLGIYIWIFGVLFLPV